MGSIASRCEPSMQGTHGSSANPIGEDNTNEDDETQQINKSPQQILKIIAADNQAYQALIKSVD